MGALVGVKAIGIEGTIHCLTTSVKGIYSLLSSIGTHDGATDVNIHLKRLDLESKIRLVDCIIKDIRAVETNTLAMCISDIKESLTNLEQILQAINERIKYNNSIWVCRSFRSYGFTDILPQLDIAVTILLDRRSALFDVLRINDKLGAISPIEK